LLLGLQAPLGFHSESLGQAQGSDGRRQSLQGMLRPGLLSLELLALLLAMTLSGLSRSRVLCP
jgi:hypothetical protein